MTLLTSIIGGGSSSGGSPTLIGEYKPILTGNTRQLGLANTKNANTIVESGGGVWIRAGQVYSQSSYPELFARLGFVNAQIGISRTMNTDPRVAVPGPVNAVAIAYNPDDDLYVIPMVSNGGNVVMANSSMQSFNYKSVGGSNTVVYYGIVYGGANGNKRFAITSNQGTFLMYSGNLTVQGPISGTMTDANSNIIFGATNTVTNTVIVQFAVGGGNVSVSTTSGASWTNANSNSLAVYDMAYGNGIYILTSFPGWVETSTNATRWSGMQKFNPVTTNLVPYPAWNGSHYVTGYTPGVFSGARLTNKLAVGSGNTLVASVIEADYAAYRTYVPAWYNHSYGHQPTVPWGGNNEPSAIYTSHDGKTWEFRGNINGAGLYNGGYGTPAQGAGSSRVTAIANGANTLIAASTWYNYHYSNPNPGTHHCGHVDNGHHDHHDCVHHGNPATPVYEDYPYNIIFTANATVTSTASANLYAVRANAVSAHNSQVIRSMTYGFTANGSAQYVYGTSSGALGSAADGYTWTSRTSPVASQINAMVYGIANSTNTFMGVGAGGIIITSTDIVNWTSRTTAFSTDSAGWGSIAYGNNTFLLAGNTGNVAISNDGVNFSGINALSAITSVAYGNGWFAAGLTSYNVKVSTDGVFWRNTGATGTTNDILTIGYGGDKFVYAGVGGSCRYIYDIGNTSATWSNATIASTNNHYSVYYSNTDSKWILGGANGTLHTSTDGITWTSRTSLTGNTILSVFYANGVYFYGGDNVLATSTDAVTWSLRNANSTGYYLRISGFAYGNGVYVYAGQGHYGTSTDAVTWIRVPAGSRDITNINTANMVYTGQINDIMYSAANAQFVAVGQGGYIAVSGNGFGWNIQNSKTGSDLTAITYGNNRYAAVGTGSAVRLSKNTIHWSGHASNSNIYSVAYYANSVNLFIMVGQSKIANTANANTSNLTYVLETSPDGVYWDTRQWKTSIPPGYAVGGNIVAAVMEMNNDGVYTNPAPGYPKGNSRVSVSTDGVNWTGLGLPGNAFASLSFVNNSFVAATSGALIANSYDGQYWTVVNVANQFATTGGNIAPAYTVTGIDWSYGFGALKFHAASGTYILPHKQGLVHFTSKDLITWTPRYAMPWNLWTNYSVDGPFVVTQLSGNTITYATDANNYISAAYNVASEFYVPKFQYPVTTGGGGFNGYGVGYQVLTWTIDPLVSQSKEGADIIYYVKAKT